MKEHILITLCLSVFLLTGCGRKEKSPVPTVTPGEIVERVGEVAITRLEAPAFDSLSQDEKTAAYYLSLAVLVGRDIPYDQIHARQSELRRFLESVSLNIGYGAPVYYVDPFKAYLKMVWSFGGFYDLQTGRKIFPPVGEREITQLIFLALSNSGGELGNVTDLNLKRNYLVDTLLNAAVESNLYLPLAADMDLGSYPQTFYTGMASPEVQKFAAQYPRNSRLERRGDRLVELAYRTGDEELSAGPYAEELARVIENLEKARPYLPMDRVAVLDEMMQYFRTGKEASFDSAVAVQRSTTTSLDFVLGFDDARFDPLHKKGLWTGILFLSDDQTQAMIARLRASAEVWPYFPGLDPATAPRSIVAAQLLTAIGANGPLAPDVYRDPPLRAKAPENSQSLVFTNVLRTRAIAEAHYIEAEFCVDSSAVQRAEKYAADIALARALLAETFGLAPTEPDHFASWQAPTPQMILERAQQEIALLWLLHDPKLIEIGLLPDAGAQDEAYRAFARRLLLLQAADSAAYTEHKAFDLIAAYLLRSGALALGKKEGRTLCLAPNPPAMRILLLDLASQIQKVLQSGDPQSAAAFLERYHSDEDPVLRGEIESRLEELPAFKRLAFIMPQVEARFNPMGGVEEIFLQQPANFTEQMLFFGGEKTVKPNQ